MSVYWQSGTKVLEYVAWVAKALSFATTRHPFWPVLKERGAPEQVGRVSQQFESQFDWLGVSGFAAFRLVSS